MRQIFLDTETTGLSADNGDRIIEIGCVEMLHRKLTGNNRHIYVNPGRDSHEEALKVHGITSEFLKDKPKFAEVAQDLLDYLKDAHVVIHNAPFDLGFLNMELALLKQPPIKEVVASITDTLVMAKEIFPGKRNSLDALCDRLEVDNSGRALHGALLDAELLADMYINLTRGQNTLLMDEGPTTDANGDRVSALDLSQFVLPVISASAQEIAAHEDVLAQIDKSSKAKTIWRTAEQKTPESVT
ncbi:MAG: DNA polymerase III subunit epsilon [Comamonadaceae bacterium CG_4_9_14_3_um_filter_60_33]|nr:MAG: DNA polymerase III subunit epsilon [Comamonadaceae bacterium CG2_30_59_20]PIY28993.1 MAG: DNA polymerase III subunit epsilon [Comamonadaceae bacterium CG_4_10_14_3_um_filter_60_42]PJB41736.1 MAG: DNA polymerase III subunit epsilon [Comamonadaceae bacterium CG_4_9_14_3_um_filter_60_33]